MFRRKPHNYCERSRVLVNAFVKEAERYIREYSYSTEPLLELEIKYLAEYTVDRLDFNDEWQMHKGVLYFVKEVMDAYFIKREDEEEKLAEMAVRAAIKEAKELGFPVARYDVERKKPYLEYPDGRRVYAYSEDAEEKENLSNDET